MNKVEKTYRNLKNLNFILIATNIIAFTAILNILMDSSNRIIFI